jgi:coenzyme PQQ precursor peptide PqqA
VAGLHVPVQAAWDFEVSFRLSLGSSLQDPVFKLPSDRLQVSNQETIVVRQENVMKTKVWTRPEVKEVQLGCEINCYAPAEI